ncbi:MAG: hypothetical protein V4700_01830 [Pseudomonadota bacterium]
MSGSINSTNVLITGSQIGTLAHPFRTGVHLASGSQFTIESSSIIAFSPGPVTTGINIDDSGTALTLNNSTISVSGAVGTPVGSNRGIDTNNATAATVTINTSNITVGTNAETVEQVGIFNVVSASAITMNGGTLAIAGTAPGPQLFTSGAPVTLNAVTCILNGTTVVCP